MRTQHTRIPFSPSQNTTMIRRLERNTVDGLDGKTIDSDWVSELELDTAMEMATRDLERTGERLKVMVLFGSLRRR